MSSDRGAAALELGIVLTVLLAIMSLTAPLAELMQRKISLERVAGSTARFATAYVANVRYGIAGQRPTVSEVVAKAQEDWAAVESPLSPLTVSVSGNPSTARPGDQVEVTVSNTVDLGPFGILLKFVNIADDTTVTVTAKAVGRQE